MSTVQWLAPQELIPRDFNSAMTVLTSATDSTKSLPDRCLGQEHIVAGLDVEGGVKFGHVAQRTDDAVAPQGVAHKSACYENTNSCSIIFFFNSDFISELFEFFYIPL